MNNIAKTEHITRENILMLLSDDEVAGVCTAETAVHPLEGEEYLDLDDLEQGVRSTIGTSPKMSRLLLRRAVHQKTWDKILQQIATLRTAQTPSKS
jgi:hypothetical protein